ncbi:hypothetical protein LVY65_11490 [Sphingomonas sp. G124]|uniref:Sugar transporter n=1 Tax=Sphingomonas cremea TaxID=2904799 RepID=A0A9X1QL25_9SPHN|nr:hypothetical protein [Sphingomonas cremea]MCF2515683.1 hypothetical protein [Sphingomonas cremea]
MTDESATDAQSGNPPIWYWVAAVGAVLFECLGCIFYLAEVRLTPEQIATLPLDQTAMLGARPGWYYAAFGVAVWVGLAGSVGLLLRRAWAVPALLVSLIAVAVQFSAVLIVPQMRTVSSDALLGPIVVALVCYGIFMLSRLAKRRGWLR